MRALVPALAASLLLASGIAAQERLALPDALPDSNDSSARFRLCQLAVIVEQSAEEKSVLPPDLLAAMAEQITFIKSDTVFNLPLLSLEDGASRLAFVDDWFVELGRRARHEGERLGDVGYRTEVLLRCQAGLWRIIREHIQVLLAWRARAMGALEGPRIEYGQPPPAFRD